MSTLTDIYYGKVDHPWGINIENWKLEAEEQKRIADYEKLFKFELTTPLDNLIFEYSLELINDCFCYG